MPSQTGIFSLSKWMLGALVFACIFIPRLPLGTLASYYSFDFRGEDLFLVLLGIFILGMIFSKTLLPGLPAIENAFLGFLVAAEISIFSGLWMRTIDKPLVSLFYLLKWFEYFLIFVITARLTRTVRASDFFVKVFFFLGIAVAFFGYWEYFSPAAKAVYPDYYRLFERPPFHGDANHIGGLLLLWIGFFTGLFLRAERPRVTGMILAGLVFVFFPFVWTYSRKSYFALAGALGFCFLFLSGRKKTLFLMCLFLILGLLFTRLPERLSDLGEAFSSVDPYHSSWAGNLTMWQQSLWNFQKFFLFGSGWGSRHRLYYESQYVLILAETGILGLAFFLRLGFRLLQCALHPLTPVSSRDRLPSSPQGTGVWAGGKANALAGGWLIAFIGFLIHNASCVSLTVAKTAVPFWFLTAVVFVPLQQAARPAHEN